MKCCEQELFYDLTGPKVADGDLKRYRTKGPDKTTQVLLEAILEQAVEGMSLLDIGGGVGTIQHELIRAGVHSAVSVEPSEAYNEAAVEEAERQGHAERITQFEGDFVQLADETPESDIVTLDRVICCYTNMPALVDNSIAKASRFYGAVYPNDNPLNGVLAFVENLYHQIRGSDFRQQVHSIQKVDGRIQKAGFKNIFEEQTFFWNVVLYARI